MVGRTYRASRFYPDHALTVKTTAVKILLQTCLPMRLGIPWKPKSHRRKNQGNKESNHIIVLFYVTLIGFCRTDDDATNQPTEDRTLPAVINLLSSQSSFTSSHHLLGKQGLQQLHHPKPACNRHVVTATITVVIACMLKRPETSGTTYLTWCGSVVGGRLDGTAHINPTPVRSCRYYRRGAFQK